MEIYNENQTYRPGDVVYVFYRNPHTQDVANVQSAAVVNNPENPNELALIFYETYYPLSNELAVYATQRRQNKLMTIILATIFLRGRSMIKPFTPQLVYFEPKALEYPLERA